MKQQCETSAECLRELARVMEQFGIENILFALNSKYVKYKKRGIWGGVPSFVDAEYWQFAIAEVEGKPVFIGDELYIPYTGKTIAQDFNGSTIEFSDGSYELPKSCSWNPPKPKTVMVEMLVEDVKYWVSYSPGELHQASEYCKRSNRFYSNCKKALEELK